MNKQEIETYEQAIITYCEEKGIQREDYDRMVSVAENEVELPEPEIFNPERSEEERMLISEQYRDDPDRIFKDPYVSEKDEIDREEEEFDPEYEDSERDVYDSEISFYCDKMNIEYEEYNRMVSEARNIRELPEPEGYNPERTKEEQDIIREYASYTKDVYLYCREHEIDRDEYNRIVSEVRDTRELPGPECVNPERSEEERLTVYEQHRDRDECRNITEFNSIIRERETGHTSELSQDRTLEEDRAIYEERVAFYCEQKGIDREEYNSLVEHSRIDTEYPEPEYYNPEHSDTERIEIYEWYRNDPDRMLGNSVEIERHLYDKGRIDWETYDNRTQQPERNINQHDFLSKTLNNMKENIWPYLDYSKEIDKYCNEHSISRVDYYFSVSLTSLADPLPAPERLNPDRTMEERFEIFKSEDPRIEYEQKRDDYIREHDMTRYEYDKMIRDAERPQDLPGPEALNPVRNEIERMSAYVGEQTRCVEKDPQISPAYFDRYLPHHKEMRDMCERYIAREQEKEREKEKEQEKDAPKLKEPTPTGPKPHEPKVGAAYIEREQDRKEEERELKESDRNITTPQNPNLHEKEMDKEKLYQEKVQEYCKEHNITERVYNLQRDAAPDLQHSPLAELYNPKYSREEVEAVRDKMVDPRIEYEQAREEYKAEHNLTHEEYKELIYKSLEERDISIMPLSEALNPSKEAEEREKIQEYSRLVELQKQYEKEVKEYCEKHHITEKAYEQQVEYTRSYNKLPSPERTNPARDIDNSNHRAFSAFNTLSDPRNEYDRAKLEYIRENNLTYGEYNKMVREAQSSRDLPICEALNPSRRIEERMDIYSSAQRDDKYIERYDPYITSAERQDVRNEQMRETYGEHSKFNFRDGQPIDPDNKYEEKVTDYCKEKGIDREEYDRIVAEAKTIKDLPMVEYENPNRSDFERLQIYESLTYRDEKVLIIPAFEHALRETYNLNPPLLDHSYGQQLIDERNNYINALSRECSTEHITKEEYVKEVEIAEYYGELRSNVEYLNPIRSENEREFIAQGLDDKYLPPEVTVHLKMTDVRYLGDIEIERVHERLHEKQREVIEPEQDKEKIYQEKIQEYCKEHNITERVYNLQKEEAPDLQHSPLAELYNPKYSRDEIEAARDTIIDPRIEYEHAREDWLRENNLRMDDYRDIMHLAESARELPPCEALNPAKTIDERVLIYSIEKDRCEALTHEVSKDYIERYNPEKTPEERDECRENIRAEQERTTHSHEESVKGEQSRDAETFIQSNEHTKEFYEYAVTFYINHQGIARIEYDVQVATAKEPKNYPEPEYTNPKRNEEERIQIYENHKTSPERVLGDSPLMERLLKERDEREHATHNENRTDNIRERLAEEREARAQEGEHENRNESRTENIRERLAEDREARAQEVQQKEYTKEDWLRQLDKPYGDPYKYYEERVQSYCKDYGISREEYDKRIENSKDIKDLPPSESRNPDRSDEERLAIYENQYYSSREVHAYDSPHYDIIIAQSRGVEDSRLTDYNSLAMGPYAAAIDAYCKEQGITREEYKEKIDNIDRVENLPRVEYLNIYRTDEERISIYEHNRIEIGRNETFEKVIEERKVERIMQVQYERVVEKYCNEHYITKDEYQKEVQSARDEGRSLSGFYPEESNPAIPKEDRDRMIADRINAEDREQEKNVEHEHKQEPER